MYLNPFKTEEALPLRQRRIWPPPIFRRMSGSSASGLPAAIRRDAHGITLVIYAVNPPEYPAQLPGNLRAIGGRLLNRLRAFFRQISATVRCSMPQSRARESEADYVSPGGASISCSPQPAALHIAPAARLRVFCLHDFARGEFLYKDDCNLFQLSAFRKNECKKDNKNKILRLRLLSQRNW